MNIKNTINILLSLIFFIVLPIQNVYADDYEEGSVRYFDDFAPAIPEFSMVAIESDEAPVEAEHKMDLILDKVIKENRITSSLKEASFLSLPVGISSGSASYMIVIDKATIYADHAEFSAFMVLTNPLDGTKIRFKAEDIAFSFDSGLLNGIKLELVDSKRSKLMKDTYLNWLPGCFVEWDCNGFKSLGINGSIELSEKSYVSVDPETGAEIGKVEANFFVSASDLQNFFIEFSLPPFKKKGFKEAYFSFTSVVLDFSDTANAPGFKFPDNYPGNFTGEMKNLWQGFYVMEAEITLTKGFNNKSGQVTSFYASDLLLDDFGLTGSFGVNNLITIDNGRLGSWPMSITKLELEFFTGDFKSFELEGGVLVQGTSTAMNYSAFYDADGIYHFGINIGGDINFDVFAANVTLNKTSRIEVTVDHGKFLPTAILHGRISFAATKSLGSDKKLLELPDLKFQGMRISAVAPVFDLEYLGMDSEEGMSFNKFPLTITEASYSKVNEGEGEFVFGVKVNLSKGEAIVGATRVAIKVGIGAGDWKYKGLALEMLTVEATKEGAYTIKGSIEFADGDPIYGDGFRGEVSAKFSESFEVDAVAVFGQVNGFRYFFVDGFVCLPPPGVVAGPFILQGFGGGLYHRMRQALPSDSSSSMGESISGIRYVPDRSSFLGIKAGVRAGVVNEKIVNCTVNFEILFNNSGGINQIGFNGEAKVISALGDLPISEMKEIAQKAALGKEQKPETTEVMSARISILQDFQNHVFHAEMGFNVNAAGLLTGGGEGVLHIEPGKWYLHLGTPNQPFNMNFVGFVKTGSYFMAGHDIPDAMNMHPKVLDYLNISEAEQNINRKENDIITGKGLAFGASFEFDTGDLKFKPFYARFEMGAGFDILLLDYGNNAYCAGREGSMGMNGWYAKGQAYAYFGGKIGVKVKVFGRRRKFDIIDIRAAAAVKIAGPNPVYIWGAVGGRYKILGGLVKGKCKFEVEVGEKCEIRTDPNDLSDLEIIADVTPMHESSEVDIFTLPQAVFNMPIEKVLKISDDKNLKKEFIIKLNKYTITQEGNLVTGQVEWNEDKTTLAFTPDVIFNPNSKYKVVTAVSFKEKVNGSWQPYKDESGKVYVESKESEFTTGKLPKRIPDEYISYSYPIDRQVNFYKDEYPTAYVTFKSDLAPFFVPVDGWTRKAKWTVKNGAPIYTDLAYSSAGKSVESPVPTQLQSSKVYLFELVNVPLDTNSAVDQNVSESTQTAMSTSDENNVEITTRSTSGNIVQSEEIAFYDIDFRCSRYAKFWDKINTNELNVRFLYHSSVAVDYPGATVYGDEMFDVFELYGQGSTEPLIKRSAVLSQADWYKKSIYPLMYEGYPFHQEARISHRDVNALGVPPTKEIYMWQTQYNYSLSATDIERGQISFSAEKTHFIYSLPKTWAKDYQEIRNKLGNLISRGYKPSAKMQAIMSKYPWPQVDAGNYPIKLEYVLPGNRKVTTSQVINLKNGFDIPQVNLVD
jgi:hypothetical protein